MVNALQDNALYILAVIVVIILCLTAWKKLRSAIRATERLKYEFISIIAHKFRTPLTYIKWSTDELSSKEQDSYKIKAINDIKASNEKLIKLTGTLVELADPDNVSSATYNREKTDLCEFVRTIGDSMRDAFHEKNLFFSVECSPEPVRASIDRERMRFVVETVLENALTYSTPGKNVDVSVALRGGKALIAVVDHGIGIDPADMPRVFTRFFRAPNAQTIDTEGFGIGLHLAQMIVRRHKGTISLYSEGLNKGTTCLIELKRTK
jgi:signal transduction histidine kinase